MKRALKNLLLGLFTLAALTGASHTTNERSHMNTNNSFEVATFAAGCFWCTEAVFERLEGVEEVQSGYSGGSIRNPSYKEVCTGRTGHAEACQIRYDPGVITYEELLDVFWHTHDPTTLNKQGNDVGSQYRSAIFYHSEAQKQAAIKSKKEMDASGTFKNPIVTEITAFGNFYVAEDYHQDYFQNNPDQPYCTFVVKPKVEKFRAKYPDRLK